MSAVLQLPDELTAANRSRGAGRHCAGLFFNHGFQLWPVYTHDIGEVVSHLPYIIHIETT